MSFDWFTFIAQLVNFVLLLVLLRVFLYRPVLNIMDQREKQLAGTWEEAEQARSEARAEAERLAAERRRLETERLERLDTIEAEAGQLLTRRLAEVDTEAAASRRRHRIATEEGREQTVQQLRERSARLLIDELRASLGELADSELEQRTIAVFAARLRNLEPGQLSELRSAAGSHTPVVTTAFDPGPDGRTEITALLREVLDVEAEPEFRQSDRLLFGIELLVGAQRVSASGSQRLESLDAAFNQVLVELIAQPGNPEEDHDADRQ